MINIELNKTLATAADKLKIKISGEPIKPHQMVQIAIFKVATRNPSFQWRSGSESNEQGEITFEVDISDFQPGKYEICHVSIGGQAPSHTDERAHFFPKRDYERKAFEVLSNTESHLESRNIILEIEECERRFETEFTSPIDIRATPNDPVNQYGVFVFVKDILISTRIRFKNMEIMPTGRGLDTLDNLNFVNDFLRNATVSGIQFEYDERNRQYSQQSNPVFVIHFPTILASSPEAARQYCEEQSNTLLLSLSLSRDAGGTIFNIVAINKENREATKYATVHPYIGNLITGWIAGETQDTIEIYIRGLKNPMNHFLVGLYKDARRERSIDFQYVRYWQILEIMAESRNYDQNSELLDYENQPMKDENGKTRKIKSSINIVFNLLRESGIGSTNSTWKNVSTWFAFRSAVAHHGSISKFESLSREDVKKWARIGFSENQNSPGHDQYLWELKEDTKLLLMKTLVESAQ